MRQIEKRRTVKSSRHTSSAKEQNTAAEKKKKDNNIYLYVQFVFTAIIIVTAFMLRNTDSKTFEYVQENYNQYFETDTYLESKFSYNTFMKKMKDELRLRYGQLTAVFNNISGKGTADIYPSNVSLDKYELEEKGVSPADGYISSPYGIRTNPFNSKEKEFHTGMDIAAAKGTFIRAAFSGTVSAAGKSDTAGNYIRIQSEDGISTLYAHNQFLFVKEGDKVLAGQVIATMGDTGLATGPHLHFEFLADGVRYNPIYALDL